MDYSIKKVHLTGIKPKYLRRFRDVPVLSQSEIHYEVISKVGKLMLKALSGFTSFFGHVIHCNDFSFFNELQEELEAMGFSFSNRFLHYILIFELSRIHIGIDNYTSYMNAVRYFQANYLSSVVYDPTYFPPNVDIVSNALQVVPLEKLKQLFFQLLEEAYQYKIVKNRILIWDCQFIHSNSSDQFNKKKMLNHLRLLR